MTKSIVDHGKEFAIQKVMIAKLYHVETQCFFAGKSKTILIFYSKCSCPLFCLRLRGTHASIVVPLPGCE